MIRVLILYDIPNLLQEHVNCTLYLVEFEK